MRIHRPIALAFFSSAVFIAAQQVPRTWNDPALSDWATPVAGLNQRPTHMPEGEYYALPVENLRTYPVYYPGREPAGYWEMLQDIGPKPLIEPEQMKTEADWIEAGRRVFDELDHIPLRTFDPMFIAAVRDARTFEAAQAKPLPDGTVFGARWVPTANGVALSFSNCANCHLLYRSDGTRVPGAPTFAGDYRISPGTVAGAVHTANHRPPAAVPLRMGDEPFGMWLFRESQVPWVKGDVHERLKSFTQDDFRVETTANIRGGAATRWNGSLFYPAKVPDLIGIKDRKYLDATATHLHRGIDDLMRYAALVSYAETVDFGPYHFLPPDGQRLGSRVPDAALYALALYIYSLQPPRNPNPFDDKAKAGQTIFQREGCAGCHTPPLYTNNKLTLAEGFIAPQNKPASLDVLPLSVGTDPSLSLKTRKGTGYYKIPSLKGLWYRGHYLHDGSAASLEEMFDPDRIKDSHVPGGWSPPGTKTRAIKGHEFGLKLTPLEREQLVAFLRTL
jgi:mono/diheme cytochrome c family protein